MKNPMLLSASINGGLACVRSSTVLLKCEMGSDQSVSVSFYYWKIVFDAKDKIAISVISVQSNEFEWKAKSLFAASRDFVYDAVVFSIIFVVLVLSFFVS